MQGQNSMAGQQQHRAYVRAEFNRMVTVRQSLCKDRIQWQDNSNTEPM